MSLKHFVEAERKEMFQKHPKTTHINEDMSKVQKGQNWTNLSNEINKVVLYYNTKYKKMSSN